MYRVRHLDVDDKVCEHVNMALFDEIYPTEGILACIHQHSSWDQTSRRVRKTTPLTLVWLLIGMGLWSRLNQCQVWKQICGKLRYLHPDPNAGVLTDAAISGRRKALGCEGLRAIMETYCRPLAEPTSVPSAFFGRYRIMAIDGTLFKTADTPANDQAFGRGGNEKSKGAFPQIRVVIASECGTHAVVGIDLCPFQTSEVHGAHRLLKEMGPETLVTIDAGILSAGFLEQARAQHVHGLGQLEVNSWAHPLQQRCLQDGSILMQLRPGRRADSHYRLTKPLWVRVISYRVTDARLGEPEKVYRLATTLLNPRTAPALSLIALYHERWEVELAIDEIKTHQREQRKVLRSKTPDGVKQELYGIFLAHYLVRALMLRAAVREDVDPDRLSFTEGIHHVCDIVEINLLLQSESIPLLRHRLYDDLVRKVLPRRLLRVNPREVKQVYNTYKPKKRDRTPPEPFLPHEQFLDFVNLLGSFDTLHGGCNVKGA